MAHARAAGDSLRLGGVPFQPENTLLYAGPAVAPRAAAAESPLNCGARSHTLGLHRLRPGGRAGRVDVHYRLRLRLLRRQWKLLQGRGLLLLVLLKQGRLERVLLQHQGPRRHLLHSQLLLLLLLRRHDCGSCLLHALLLQVVLLHRPCTHRQRVRRHRARHHA
jgi:hypothetical protein